jgi:BirA family transcriptional regulator, biotin operon repressor / biotin---[acetyl-CoA-carboxylase] ligase
VTQIELALLTERLIALLRKRPGQYVVGEKLILRLQTDHSGLERALKQAAVWEYKLRRHAVKGVKFVAAPDLLTATEIHHDLKTRVIGRMVHACRSVKSTNDLASKLADEGAVEGVIITAEKQTRGRGRLGRHWYSPPRTGTYLSIILRPKFPPEDAPGLSVMTAVALADSVAHWKPGLVQIKWPNDVWINGRKTAGILTELSAERNKISHVIVGIGINVNHKASDFPDDLRATATSLRRELRHKVDRLELLRLFLLNFEREYAKYCRHRLKKSLSKVRKYSALIGREVTLQSGAIRVTGVVMDIDSSGALIMQTSGGREIVTAGEVTVVKQ